MKLPSTQKTVIGCVSILAAGAAAVSFTHVYGLARAARQAPAVALVYPVLTDVLVLSATVCLLHAAQHNLRATLPRWAFALGVVATIAANTGDYFRPNTVLVGAVVSAWAAVAFIFGALLGHWYWNNTTPSAPEVTSSAPKIVSSTPNAQEILPTAPPTPLPGPPHPAPPNETSTSTKTAQVLAALQTARAAGENPTAATLAQQCGVSGTLARNVLRATSNGHTT